MRKWNRRAYRRLRPLYIHGLPPIHSPCHYAEPAAQYPQTLPETYSILSQSESFERKFCIHILQCDERVQSDLVVENRKQLRAYMEHFQVQGLGGTDFRPAFAYVNLLLAKKVFRKLRGLIYFTDGYGTFPVKKPPYDTAFVFFREDYLWIQNFRSKDSDWLKIL